MKRLPNVLPAILVALFVAVGTAFGDGTGRVDGVVRQILAGGFTITEGAAPTTPAASNVAIYAKSDGFLYSKDDAGTERPLNGPSVLTKSATAVTTTGTVEETLWSYSLPAGTLATNGQGVRIKVFGFTAANGNSKTTTLKFGGTTLRTTTHASNNLGWFAEATVLRSSATTQAAMGLGFVGSVVAGFMGATSSTPAETLSGAVTIAFTATTATQAGDLTITGAIVEFLP